MGHFWVEINTLGLRIVNDARLDPAGHKKFVQEEMVRWSKVIKDSGETAD